MPASSSRCASLPTNGKLPPAWCNTVMIPTQVVCIMLLSTSDDAALQCNVFRAIVGIRSSPRMQVSSFFHHSSLQLAGILAVAFTDIAQCQRDGQHRASAHAFGCTWTFSQHHSVSMIFTTALHDGNHITSAVATCPRHHLHVPSSS